MTDTSKQYFSIKSGDRERKEKICFTVDILDPKYWGVAESRLTSNSTPPLGSLAHYIRYLVHQLDVNSPSLRLYPIIAIKIP